MASTPKKPVRPTMRTPTEDADPVGCARKFAEVDAGAGPGVQVTVDLKITVHARHARGLAGPVRDMETLSAEFSDQHSSDQQPDAPED